LAVTKIVASNSKWDQFKFEISIVNWTYSYRQMYGIYYCFQNLIRSILIWLNLSFFYDASISKFFMSFNNIYWIISVRCTVSKLDQDIFNWKKSQFSSSRKILFFIILLYRFKHGLGVWAILISAKYKKCITKINRVVRFWFFFS
jgi:hypothetical protein